MPSNFKPPPDEADRRLLARELFVKGKTAEEITEVTNLDRKTVDKIIQWCKSDQGQLWIQKRYPEGVQKEGGAEGQPGGEEASAETGERPPASAQAVALASQGPGQGQPKVQSTGRPPPGPAGRSQYVVLTPEQFAALVEKGAGGSLPAVEEAVQSENGGQTIFREGGASMETPALTGKFTQTFVKPWTVIWFMRMVGMGYKRDMSSFIEECVVGHMKQKYGLSYAMVREE